MEKKENLSDERLVCLHQRKRLNAFFTIYNRYKNYGYSIVITTLKKYQFYNALREEKDAILYDSIIEALDVFDKKRGTFRNLISSIIEHQTIAHIREFSRDPLSDYISLDASYKEGTNLRFADSLTFADKSDSPKQTIELDDNEKEAVINCSGIHKRRIKEMIRLRKLGYSFEEIAKKFKTTKNAVRAVFYRIKKRINVKKSSKLKK